METPFLAGKFKEYSNEDIRSATDNFKNAKEITKMEGEKLSLIFKDGFYALRREQDHTILGWIGIEPSSEFNIVKMIYIRSEFRKTGAVLILLNGIKEVLDNPLIITNNSPVFTDGANLIKRLHDNPRFSIKTLDVNTKEINDFNSNDINNQNKSIIIENTHLGLFGDYPAPGCSKHHICFTLFEELSEDLYN